MTPDAGISGPHLAATEAERLAVYRLRVDVWKGTETMHPDAFPDGIWMDASDDDATHWYFRHGDRVIAAARLRIVGGLADVSEAGEYEAWGLEATGPVAEPGRVVVDARFRKAGLASRLLDLQDEAIDLSPATLAVRQASSAMLRLLSRRGWKVVGPAGADWRFPGMTFSVAYRNF